MVATVGDFRLAQPEYTADEISLSVFSRSFLFFLFLILCYLILLYLVFFVGERIGIFQVDLFANNILCILE